MTLGAIMEKQYQPDELYTMPSTGDYAEHYRSLCNDWNADRKAQLRVVKGHIRYRWHNAFGNDSHEYITVLRHPIERVLSYYSFIGDWSPDRKFGIDELVQQSDQASNLATFMLSGGAGRDPKAFQDVWAKILRGEILAGTVERFVDYVEYLRNRYGWTHDDYEAVNITPDRVGRDEVSRETHKLIIKHNWYDYMLYLGVLYRKGASCLY